MGGGSSSGRVRAAGVCEDDMGVDGKQFEQRAWGSDGGFFTPSLTRTALFLLLPLFCCAYSICLTLQLLLGGSTAACMTV
jgi:hypothetical protein